MSSHPALDSTHVTALGARGEAWSREAVVSHDTTRQAQMGKIFGYTKGLHAVHLIAIGARLGLFERLAASAAGLTPDALAAAAGLHPPYIQLWCEAACALELLVKTNSGVAILAMGVVVALATRRRLRSVSLFAGSFAGSLLLLWLLAHPVRPPQPVHLPKIPPPPPRSLSEAALREAAR